MEEAEARWNPPISNASTVLWLISVFPSVEIRHINAVMRKSVLHSKSLGFTQPFYHRLFCDVSRAWLPISETSLLHSSLLLSGSRQALQPASPALPTPTRLLQNLGLPWEGFVFQVIFCTQRPAKKAAPGDIWLRQPFCQLSQDTEYWCCQLSRSTCCSSYTIVRDADAMCWCSATALQITFLMGLKF